jgi:hypothetical protein
MRPRLLDTQKAIELGPDGTGNLEGSWAVTTYTCEEWADHNLEVYPADTTFLETDSWPDFTLRFSSERCSLWEWESSSTTWRIQHSVYGFGKAACGHTATIMVSSGESVYYLCDRFRSNADMSNFTAVIEGLAKYPFTGDACLGKICKFYQNPESYDSTS